MPQYTKANDLNLGYWSKITRFAKHAEKEVFLEGSEQVSASCWDAVLIEMPGNGRENFICRAVTELRPDEVTIVKYDDRDWLRMWFD